MNTHKANHPPLRFRPDGTFRVLQLADVQQPAKVTLDTMRLLDALLETAKPDLVVFTGDQIKGYSPSYRRCTETRVFETIKKITAPVRRRGIPFAVTFGNHDNECGIGNSEQANYYRKLPGCLMPANGPNAGSYQLTIAHSQTGRPALALYLVDTGGALRGGGYEAVPKSIIRWLVDAQRQLCLRQGLPIPAIVFQHIPVPEYYRLLTPLAKKQPGSIYGIGHHRGFYQLNHSLCHPGGRLAEAPSSPTVNTGEFTALQHTPGFFALFCGHDHRNSFSGRLEGMELGYTPSCGFDSYGPGVNRGGRLFVFRQQQTADFDTQLFTYRQLIGKIPLKPLRNFIDSSLPANVDEAKDLLRKLTVSAVVATAIGVAIRRYSRNR